jgi:chaperonin GroEL
MTVEYDNAKVLITDMKIESIKDIIPILEQVTRVNQPLVIIAEDVTGEHQSRDPQRVGFNF